VQVAFAAFSVMPITLTSVGNAINVPPPAIEFIAEAANAVAPPINPPTPIVSPLAQLVRPPASGIDLFGSLQGMIISAVAPASHDATLSPEGTFTFNKIHRPAAEAEFLNNPRKYR
jgi:hypothetical protein